MKKSSWLKIDLHIHSPKSNEVIDGDYTGPNYTADDLIKTMKENNVNIFSVTDHSIFNMDLYVKLFTKTKLHENLNFLVGIELDIEDADVDKDLFHCIMLFDFDESVGVEEFKKRMENINSRLELNKTRKSFNIRELFENLYNEKQEENYNFMLIPHYNRKERGITRSKAIEFNLNKSFNAFEDRNNLKVIKGIVKQKLNEYKEGKAELVFSDCHDISNYPIGKTGKREEDFYFPEILGNIKNPFKTLQLAITDHKLRVRISTNGEEHRKDAFGIEKIFIDYIDANKVDLEISPYQNSIIGNYASGKSFLLNLLYFGLENESSDAKSFNEKYSFLLEKINKIEITYKGNIYSSLVSINTGNFKILKYEQMEGILHSTKIDEDYKKHLEKQFNIKFPSEVKYIENEEIKNEVIESYKCITEKYKKKVNDIFEVDKLLVNPTQPSINYSEEKNETNVLEEAKDNGLLSQLMLERSRSLYDIDIYSINEKDKINEVIDLINRKSEIIDKFQSYNTLYTTKIKKEIKGINGDNEQLNQTILESKAVAKNDFLDLKKFYESIIKLERKCKQFEQEYSESNLLAHTKKKTIKFDSFNTLVVYGNNKHTTVELINGLSNLTIFHQIITRIAEKQKFKNERSTSNPEKRLDTILENYVNEYVAFMNDSSFDIEVGSQSILRESAGGRAKMMLDISFEVMKSLISLNNDVLFLVDQPEDQMDNKNIYKEFTARIRKLKQKNEFPQTIMVSHSGNATIATDSEIYIYSEISNTEKKYESLTLDCIESNNIICEVLDGGKEALNHRMNKYKVGE